MAMHDLDPLADKDLSQKWERAEDGWKCSAAVDNPVWEMVHLESVCKIPDACARRVGWRTVGVGDDDDIVAAVDQLLFMLSIFANLCNSRYLKWSSNAWRA